MNIENILSDGKTDKQSESDIEVKIFTGIYPYSVCPNPNSTRRITTLTKMMKPGSGKIKTFYVSQEFFEDESNWNS